MAKPNQKFALSNGQTLSEASAASGIPLNTLYHRIERGMSPDQAVAEGRRARGRASRIKLQDGSFLSAAVRSAPVDRCTVYRRVRLGTSPDEALS